MKAIHDLLPLPLRHRKTAALFFSWSLKRKGGKEDLNFLPTKHRATLEPQPSTLLSLAASPFPRQFCQQECSYPASPKKPFHVLSLLFLSARSLTHVEEEPRLEPRLDGGEVSALPTGPHCVYLHCPVSAFLNIHAGRGVSILLGRLYSLVYSSHSPGILYAT